MKPKYQRMRFVGLSLLVMAAGAALLLRSFQDNLVFFYTPTQWQEKSAQAGFDRARAVRIGGLVKEGSVKRRGPSAIRFSITDGNREIVTDYQGLLPSLFREGQGVVAQGSFGADDAFRAETILAKHDERYMPREVVEQLKQSGRWQQ